MGGGRRERAVGRALRRHGHAHAVLAGDLHACARPSHAQGGAVPLHVGFGDFAQSLAAKHAPAIGADEGGRDGGAVGGGGGSGDAAGAVGIRIVALLHYDPVARRQGLSHRLGDHGWHGGHQTLHALTRGAVGGSEGFPSSPRRLQSGNPGYWAQAGRRTFYVSSLRRAWDSLGIATMTHLERLLLLFRTGLRHPHRREGRAYAPDA